MQLTDGKILLRPAEMKDAKEMFSAVRESMLKSVRGFRGNIPLGRVKNWIKTC